MHMNAPCTKYSIENAHECKQMHQYQNASYMNAYKCNNMQYHAEGDECIWMKCNENVKNASKCMNMHLNAYGKKQHHFREKTTRIPCTKGSAACAPPRPSGPPSDAPSPT